MVTQKPGDSCWNQREETAGQGQGCCLHGAGSLPEQSTDEGPVRLGLQAVLCCEGQTALSSI